jgi:alkylation response protein AidB-like acyl-CoA dehydrogenase
VAVYGTDQQKEKYIPPVCRGEASMSIAITEPTAGSAATELKTRAVQDGDHYVLNGAKSFISDGDRADAFMVYCRFGEGIEGIGSIIVDRDTPGFTVGRDEPNMSGAIQNQLFFEDAMVPAGNVLIKEDGFRRMMMAFNAERCGNSTMSLVTAQCAFEKALAYSQERAQFGQPISEFQGIQWMLADMKVKIDAARLLIYRAVINGEQGFPSPGGSHRKGVLQRNGRGSHQLRTADLRRIWILQGIPHGVAGQVRPRLDDRRRDRPDPEEQHRT